MPEQYFLHHRGSSWGIALRTMWTADIIGEEIQDSSSLVQQLFQLLPAGEKYMQFAAQGISSALTPLSCKTLPRMLALPTGVSQLF